MKKEKKDLAKLALAGLLLAATIPAAGNAEINNQRETYLATAACAAGSCAGRSTGNAHSCAVKSANPYNGGEVADADAFSTPNSANINRNRVGGGTYDNNAANRPANNNWSNEQNRAFGGGYSSSNDQNRANSYANPNDPNRSFGGGYSNSNDPNRAGSYSNQNDANRAANRNFNNPYGN